MGCQDTQDTQDTQESATSERGGASHWSIVGEWQALRTGQLLASGVVLRSSQLSASGKRFALATHSWLSWVSWVSWPGASNAQRLRAFPATGPRLCHAAVAGRPPYLSGTRDACPYRGTAMNCPVPLEASGFAVMEAGRYAVTLFS